MQVVIRPQEKTSFPLKELWEFRELIYFLAWRDIKVRYKQTLIGILWAILQPFLTMIVFTFLFNRVIGISSGNIPYPVFVFTGLVFWNYFSTSLQEISNSLIANQSIITKVFFPKLIIPITASIVPLVDFIFALLFLYVLLLYFQITVSFVSIFFIVPAIIFTMISAIGIGSFLAILNVKYRDVRYALPFFLQLLLFVTPIIYSLKNVSPELKILLSINPVTSIIVLAREVFLHEHEVKVIGIVVSLFSSLAVFALGIWFFQRYERKIVDNI